MRILFVIGLAVSFASAPLAAQSNPSWWNLSSPDATALVGIQWENLRHSPFADAVGAEIASSGNLGFPDLACITDAKQILISSPALLAIAAGTFPTATIRTQAAAQGMKPARYRGIDLWISPGKDTLSVAQWTEGLLLIGMRKTLEAAIDRNLPEADTSEEGRTAVLKRLYSPLLSRGARIAGGRDLWVVTSQMPDPLASLFVPLDAEAKSFEGALSVRNGLDMQGTIDAGSPQGAAEIAQVLEESIPKLPAVARDLTVKVTSNAVTFGLFVNQEQLTASLRSSPPAASPEPAAPPAPLAARSVAPTINVPIVPEVASSVVPESPKPVEPQVIRIFGLDEGTREIVLAPQ